jgi:hypothetical protein
LLTWETHSAVHIRAEGMAVFLRFIFSGIDGEGYEDVIASIQRSAGTL